MGDISDLNQRGTLTHRKDGRAGVAPLHRVRAGEEREHKEDRE